MSRGRDWSVLRGDDPVPGDPPGLQQLAHRYAGTADALQRGADGLRRIEHSGTAWESAAGRAFTRCTRETAASLEQVCPRYTATAQALHRYAGDLEQVQDDADAVLRRAWQAFDELAAIARTQGWSGVNEPAVAQQMALQAEHARRRLDLAGRELQAVEAAWSRAGQVAAGALEEATSVDGLDDGRWEFFAVVEAITDAASALSMAFGGAALLCAVIPGLQPFAGAFGLASAATGLVSLAGSAVLLAGDRITTDEFLVGVAGTLVGLGAMGVGYAIASGAVKSVGAAVQATGQAAPAARAAVPPPARMFDGTSNALPGGQALLGGVPPKDDPRRRARRAEPCPA